MTAEETLSAVQEDITLENGLPLRLLTVATMMVRVILSPVHGQHCLGPALLYEVKAE